MRQLVILSVAVAVMLLSVGSSLAGSLNLRTHLKGGEEVPAVITNGQGQALFKLAPDGNSIDFKLIAANIENVTQSHIHCGLPGTNGPVVVFLYGFGPIVSPNGVLSQGTITAANVIPRPASAACPGGVATLADVIAKLQSGGAYVNIHTTANPGGEIRGQVE